MQRLNHFFLTVALALVSLTSGCTTSSVDGGELYTGQWAAKDASGNAYTIQLHADGTATAHWPGHPDETGQWVINDEMDAEIQWMNGWRDIIHLAEPESTSRIAFRPGTASKGDPALVGTVSRIVAPQ